MNELENKQSCNLITEEDVQLLIQFEKLQAKVKVMKSQKDAALKEWMIQNGLKSFDDEVHGIKITYVPCSKRKTVDTSKLKEDGIYELYCHETDVSDSVRVTVNYD